MLFKVNNQLPPNRCTICHQADLFDPNNDYCQRCADLEIPRSTTPTLLRRRSTIVEATIICAAIISSTTAITAVTYTLADITCLIAGFFIKGIYQTSFWGMPLGDLLKFLAVCPGLFLGAIIGVQLGQKLSRNCLIQRQHP